MPDVRNTFLFPITSNEKWNADTSDDRRSSQIILILSVLICVDQFFLRYLRSIYAPERSCHCKSPAGLWQSLLASFRDVQKHLKQYTVRNRNIPTRLVDTIIS